MALRGGVDLVLELPAPWNCARAQDFARAGVSLLHAMGCVELLSFGSECGSTDRLCDTAQALESPEMRDCLRGFLNDGMSLPARGKRRLRNAWGTRPPASCKAQMTHLLSNICGRWNACMLRSARSQ